MKFKILPKIIMLTKLSFKGLLIQCLFLNMLWATNMVAQNVKSVKEVYINLNVKNANLYQLFEEIEKQTAFSFTYSREDLDQQYMLTRKNRNLNLAEVLMDVSRETNLVFKQVNLNITVSKNRNSKINQSNDIEIIIQSKRVSGKVVAAEDGESIPGVNVIEQGTSNGTVTNVNGEYSISVSENAILVFSSVGYATQEVAVGNQSVLDIRMEQDVTQLEELVVTGYGTVVKRDYTGSVASVKSEQIAALKAPSLDAALQGQAPGLQVAGQSGTPGAPVRVLVRGTNSLTSGTEPLWVVDGVFINNPIGGFASGQGGAVGQSPLANINPNDIESIEVLKDAAATAIYGSRGSNGVIIVTTKSGKGSKGTLNIDLSRGITDLTRSPEDIGFVNGDEWVEIVDQARSNSGLGEFETGLILNDGRDPNAVLDRSQFANTNWFDQILQQGSFTDLNISSSKGGDKMSYFLSGQYRDDNGVLKGNRFQRASTRANLEFSPVNNLTFGAKLNFSYTKNERVRSSGSGAPGGNNQIAFGGFGQANGGALPIFPIFHPTVTNADGSPAYFDPLSGNNLVASSDRNNLVNDNIQYRGIGSFFVQYDLPWLKGLSIRSEAGVDLVQSNSLLWANTEVRVGSAYAFQQTNTFRNINYNTFASYNQSFGEAHSINAVFGVEAQRAIGQGMYIEGDQLIGQAQQVGTPVNPIRVGGNFGGGERYLLSYFGRANYKFKDKYLLGASLRRDGSSVFVPENRWSFFSALSAGWIISEEPFMQSLGFIGLLKLRGSYGQTGNQDISPVATTDGFTGWARYGSRDNLVGSGDNVSRIGNENLTWETTNAYDLGIDFELFNNRLSGSVVYYQQNVTDMILNVPVAQSSGIFSGGPSIAANIGDMNNFGFEFLLNAVVLDKNDFRWDVNFNFTTNRNEIKALEPSLDAGGNGVNTGNTISRTGGRLGAFYMNMYAGIDPATGIETIYALDSDHLSETGEYRKLMDAEGNPVIIPATRRNTDRNRFLMEDITGLPTFFGGLTNSFSYKGFDFTAFLAFQGGNYLYHDDERGWTNVGGGNGILLKDVIDNTWTPQNQNAKYMQLRWNYRYDIGDDGSSASNQRYDIRRAMDRYVYKGDFLRLRTLQFGYTLPASVTRKFSVNNMRIYLIGNNLFTASEFPGYDPEALQLGDSQNRNLGQGFVGAQIPQLKSFVVGVNIGF